MKELSTGREMKYEYTLDCYNESGRKREITFKTVRVLRDRAYLALEMRAFGLTSWEEVAYSELPEEVQEKICSGNFLRIAGETPRPLNREAAARYLQGRLENERLAVTAEERAVIEEVLRIL